MKENDSVVTLNVRGSFCFFCCWANWEISDPVLLQQEVLLCSHTLQTSHHADTSTHPGSSSPLGCHTHTLSCCFSSSWSFLCRTCRLQAAAAAAASSHTVSLLTITYCVATGFNKYSAFCCWTGGPGSEASALRRSWVIHCHISGCSCSVDAVSADCETVDLQQVFVGPVLRFRGSLCLLLLLFFRK